jgi:prepilin-type N-terminal cleavage/methylation domain-containing protein
MLRSPDRSGFSLVEVVVALVILSTAVLGLASSASRLTTTAAAAQVRALAMESVQDRLARVRLDPRYGALDSLYTGTDTDISGIKGLTRTTKVVHIKRTSPSLDYKQILVTVTGPTLETPVSRVIVIAAP